MGRGPTTEARGRASSTWRRLAVACLALASACIAASPEDREREDLGEARDGDEEHRPGQPCLVCHAADYNPGDAVFVLAGTVYRTATTPDDRGLDGADVVFLDDAGREFSARTNSVGNFMVEVDTGLAAPQQRDRGRLAIPWDPTFPINVAVAYGDEEKSMETLIWREGSCAGCHLTDQPGTDHVEKVWFQEAAL